MRKKCGVMMAKSRWAPFTKFCKNKFRLFCKRQAGREKAQLLDGEFAMATIREILQKRKSTFFKRQAGRKKARCHDGELAMATLYGTLQKLFSSLLKASSKAKISAAL